MMQTLTFLDEMFRRFADDSTALSCDANMSELGEKNSNFASRGLSTWRLIEFYFTSSAGDRGPGPVLRTSVYWAVEVQAARPPPRSVAAG